ncbi:hypothetical protein POVWA2_084390 [Plasmodium ovale wallikeri]|uniref:PIR Superfamily Protein n=1 Tax=Plasmodium ovale wallikeri TaxID=864142 RepID=A0A1A9AIU1_PLAOA|nr:hypothetical protein POVWA1_074370 [Plasmodium ovale wallikeri]SBT58337.1 hypothetical protein POVWA2_084390 [Plasmodium ovale wallikeri]
MSTPLRKEQFYEKCFILNNSCVQKHHAGYTDVSKCNDPVLQNIDLSLSENYKYEPLWKQLERSELENIFFLRNPMNFTGSLPKAWIPNICTKSLFELPENPDQNCSAHTHSALTASRSSASIVYFTNIESLFRSKIRKKINLWNVNSEHGKTEFSEDYFHNEDISSNNTLNNTFYQPT